MLARFPGLCAGTGDAVKVGDEIVRDGRGWSHPAHLSADCHCSATGFPSKGHARGSSGCVDSPRVAPWTRPPAETTRRSAVADRVAYPDYAAEAAADARRYKAAVAALTPAQKRGWDAVLYDNEFFDGEDAIALSRLNAMKASRTLAGYRSRTPRY